MSGVDQRDMGQGLREIAGLTLRLPIVLFCQQTNIVDDRGDAIEHELRRGSDACELVSIGQP